MRLPAFPFYPDNWLASSRVSSMKPEQEGAYVRLLAYQWNSEDQTIPADDDSLAAMSRLNGRWHEIGAKVRACFEPVADMPGHLRNERLFAEWEKTAAYREAQAKKGRLGMAHRWAGHQKKATNRDNPRYNCDITAPITEALPGDNLQSQSQSQSQSQYQEKTPPRARTRTRKSTALIPDTLSRLPGWEEAWAAWLQFRRGKRAPVTDRVAHTVLSRLSERPTEAVSALDTCTVAGWTDVRWDWIDNRNAKVPAGQGPRLTASQQQDMIEVDAEKREEELARRRKEAFNE